MISPVNTSPEARRNYVGPSAARLSSALPEDARAIIEREPRPATQSAPAHRRGWRLRFQRRLPFGEDPLTGWTTGSDPLAHLSLRFPDLAAAIRFAEQHDLPYEVREEPSAKIRPPARPHRSDVRPLRLDRWPAGVGASPKSGRSRSDAGTMEAQA